MTTYLTTIGMKISKRSNCIVKYPGVAQLVGRLVWDQDAASSSLATRTTVLGRLNGLPTPYFFALIFCYCPIFLHTSWTFPEMCSSPSAMETIFPCIPASSHREIVGVIVKSLVFVKLSSNRETVGNREIVSITPYFSKIGSWWFSIKYRGNSPLLSDRLPVK